jgi:hypothetical protein
LCSAAPLVVRKQSTTRSSFKASSSSSTEYIKNQADASTLPSCWGVGDERTTIVAFVERFPLHGDDGSNHHTVTKDAGRMASYSSSPGLLATTSVKRWASHLIEGGPIRSTPLLPTACIPSVQRRAQIWKPLSDCSGKKITVTGGTSAKEFSRRCTIGRGIKGVPTLVRQRCHLFDHSTYNRGFPYQKPPRTKGGGRRIHTALKKL